MRKLDDIAWQSRRVSYTYNCMGYAFGVEKWLVLHTTEYDCKDWHGYTNGCKNLDALIDERAKFVLKYFPEYRIISEEKMLTLPRNLPLIALCIGRGDFHFMKRNKDGEWWEKMGAEDIEYCTNNDIPNFSSRYNSKRLYFVKREELNHEQVRSNVRYVLQWTVKHASNCVAKNESRRNGNWRIIRVA